MFKLPYCIRLHSFQAFKVRVTLTFNISMWLKLNCNIAIGLPIYNSLSVFNSNIWHNCAALHLQNLDDLAFDFSRWHKVSCNGAVRLNIYDFLLVPNITACVSISHGLPVSARNFNVFPPYLTIGPKSFDPHTYPLIQSDFSHNLIISVLVIPSKWRWLVK